MNAVKVATNTTKQPPRLRERHLSHAPHTHGLCGVPRGDRPLRADMPKEWATCVLCRGLADLPTGVT